MPPDLPELSDLSDEEFDFSDLLQFEPSSSKRNKSIGIRQRSTRATPSASESDASNDDLDSSEPPTPRRSNRSSPASSRTRTLRSKDERRFPDTDSHNAEARFLKQYFPRHESKEAKSNWVKVDLSDFCVYEKSTLSSEIRSLRDVSLHVHTNSATYYFDGKLTHENGSSQNISSVDVTSLQIDSLGGLDEDDQPIHTTCTDAIYLQTKNARKFNCFYRLQKPNAVYTPHYESFTWLALFLKYIIDYLERASASNKNVCLDDFQINFFETIQRWHSGSAEFQSWHDRCNCITDFRRHLACAQNLEFIAGRADDIKDDELVVHRLWEDLGRPLDPAPKPDSDIAEQVLVTPHAAHCFLPSYPAWGETGYDLLQIAELGDEAARWQAERRSNIGIGNKPAFSAAHHFENHGGISYSVASLLLEGAERKRPSDFRLSGQEILGKAIIVRKHGDGCTSRPCFTCPMRFAVVLQHDKTGSLRVRWLDLPANSICSGLRSTSHGNKRRPFYPIGNELFFTDECSCDPIYLRDVLSCHRISVNGDHAESGDELFVHRQYTGAESAIHIPTSDKLDDCPRHDQHYKLGSQSYVHTESSYRKVKLMSLFSGCGLMDNGLERGSDGLFETVFGAEYDAQPFLSLKANHSGRNGHRHNHHGHHKDCPLHNQDVNKLFKKFCAEGNMLDIDFFAAGCPCQGWSRLNRNWEGEKSQRNCALLAHTLSWIEVFLPRMVLIENVMGMDDPKPSGAGQAASFLASLGYQAKLTAVNAKDFGGATSRDRLFIVATVPGISLPRIPDATHGDWMEASPIPTTSSVTSDLNTVDNSTSLNIRYPDHTPVRMLEAEERGIVAKIPRRVSPDRKMASLADAVPLLTKAEAQWLRSPRKSKKVKKDTAPGAYRRVHPNRPKGTILTKVALTDGQADGFIHWIEDRAVTLEELRRWQGVPDDYILIGDKISQIKQIGNSVPWATSTLWGRLLAQSWRESKYGGGKIEQKSEDDGTKLEKQSKVEDLSDSEHEDMNAVEKQSWHRSMSMRALRQSLPPNASGDREDNGQTNTKVESDDAELPELDDVFTPISKRRNTITPPSRKRNADTLDDDDDDSDIVTPTKRRRQFVKKTAISERLSVTPGGSVHLTRETKSSITEELFEKPRPRSKKEVKVNVPKRTDKHGYYLSGHSTEDAIVLDD